jgi:hypothetical protein
MPQLSAKSLVQDGSMALNPSPKSRMINGEPSLVHQFLEISIAQSVARFATEPSGCTQESLRIPKLTEVARPWLLRSLGGSMLRTHIPLPPITKYTRTFSRKALSNLRPQRTATASLQPET